MAKRPVFVSRTERWPRVQEVTVEFRWVAGQSAAQKQRRIEELHSSARSKLGEETRILEISSHSPEDLGCDLSAFALEYKADDRRYRVEALFQGSKVFSDGSGPFPELYEVEGREARRRLHDECAHLPAEVTLEKFVPAFQPGEAEWPAATGTAFYDWLYISALLQDGNRERAERLLDYRAFTDIEFNPARSLNCQARAAALFRALREAHGWDELEKLVGDRDRFLEVHRKATAKEPVRAFESRQETLFQSASGRPGGCVRRRPAPRP
jgi:hypothetical protein